jgi:hypothetical protein
VFVQGVFWGYLGCNGCAKPRVFTDDETDVLRSAGLLLSNAIIRNEMTQNIMDTALQLKAAIEEANNQTEKLRLLVEKLLGQQANAGLKAEGLQWNKDFFEKLEVDDETRAQMEQDISEDGYYGVKQTSERILDFAKALSGGDPSKIDMLRDAVQKGFDAAEKQWGDKLPEISYKTLDAVMKGFDEWAAEASK